MSVGCLLPAVALSQPLRALAGDGPYSGNRESKVFHKQTCRYYGCGACSARFQTREEAIRAGYRPCGTCKP